MKEKVIKTIKKPICKYAISSFVSSVLDLALFQLLCFALRGRGTFVGYVFIAAFTAKALSSVLHYFMNYYIVFQSNEGQRRAFILFTAQVFAKVLISSIVVEFMVNKYPNVMELCFKVPVEVLLFFLTYRFQKKLVYRK